MYFLDTAEVPESQAVNIRNRSYAIGALVDIPAPGEREFSELRCAVGVEGVARGLEAVEVALGADPSVIPKRSSSRRSLSLASATAKTTPRSASWSTSSASVLPPV